MRGIFYLHLLVFLHFVATPALADEGQKSYPVKEQTLSIPLETVLPCTKDDKFKAFTLKAPDGKNIRLAIICRNGRLHMHLPDGVLPPFEQETEGAP